MTRILAMYLPQFHRIAENDRWWGEGFTEWTAVKSAEKLFPEHEAPYRPMQEYYYDLSERKTMEWQSRLMKEGEIDGFCMYHYYFKDGKKLLEKPAENLLKWTDIDMPFCFSWANEAWVRSWSRLNESEGNPWSAKFDGEQRNSSDGGENGILMEQNYGGEEEWKKHFDYLLPFFSDTRYIKQDGKPVFMIYKPDNIDCLAEMLACWDSCAREAGFQGLYVIGTNLSGEKPELMQNTSLQEPQDSIIRFFPEKYGNDKGVMKYISYDEIWRRILQKKPERGSCLGAFSGYDDTARRERAGVVIYGRSPEKFRSYLTEMICKAENNESPFLFINAWNEWGEGMYLEPDEQHGKAFLSAISEAREAAEAADFKAFMSKEDADILREELHASQSLNARYKSYWRSFDRWMSAMENGKSFRSFFKRQGIRSFGIYGMGMLGKHLLFQMEREELKPDFLIDGKGTAVEGYPVYRPGDVLPETELIIVTVMYEFENIRRQLKAGQEAEIISLDRLLEEINGE